MSRANEQNIPVNKAFKVDGVLYFYEDGSAYVVLRQDFGLPIGTKIRRARRQGAIEIIPAGADVENGHSII